MASAKPQEAVDAITEAAEWWPYDFRFRVAQARWLHGLTAKVPEAAEITLASIAAALRVDPESIELHSMALVIYRQAGLCDQAELTANRMRALAPRNKWVQYRAAFPCP